MPFYPPPLRVAERRLLNFSVCPFPPLVSAGTLLSLSRPLWHMSKDIGMEAAGWLEVLASDSGLPARLFATASFAWAFYLVNAFLGRLNMHRRGHIKTVLVPSLAIPLATYLGGRWIFIGTLAAMWWAVISIVVWEADFRARREAEQDFHVFVHHENRNTRSGQRGTFTLPEDATPDTVYPATSCSICLMEFEDAPETPDDRQYTLTCGHQGFHRGCLGFVGFVGLCRVMR